MEYFIESIRRFTSRIGSSHRRLDQLVNGKRIKFKQLLFTVNDDVIEWKYNGRPTTLYSTQIEPEFPWHFCIIVAFLFVTHVYQQNSNSNYRKKSVIYIVIVLKMLPFWFIPKRKFRYEKPMVAAS